MSTDEPRASAREPMAPPPPATGEAASNRPRSRLLIDVDPHQRRVALLEADRLVEIYVERIRAWSAVGSVYKGRVTRVLPGIQAAFVDIGLDRDAFLYVDDVRRIALDELDADDNGDGSAATEPPPSARIQEVLTTGQEMLVQVLKDPLPNKGARISAQVTLPGRFLVYLPTLPQGGVSRRIEDEEERSRLRNLAEGLGTGAAGLIVRTAAQGRGRAELTADLAYLKALWEEVKQRAEAAQAPALVHHDLDLPLRAVRDLLSAELTEVWVTGEATWRGVVDLLRRVGTPLVERVRLYQEPTPLFERFGVEAEIEAALKSRVPLRSGGYLVIHPTEALVAIDVNSGRYVGRSNLEDTVVRLNLEAVAEVVRQIRLRDLAGIIVVDFIDMEEPENRRQVFEALERELKRDRARNRVLAISDFGLVEITRKRARTNLYGLMTRACPVCEASGRIKSASTVCLEIRRHLLARREQLAGRPVRIEAHPDVVRALGAEEREILAELEAALGAVLGVEERADLHPEQFHVLPGAQHAVPPQAGRA